MAINYASPPGDSEQIALTGLQHLARSAQDLRAPDLMALRADELELFSPHAVHHVRLDDLAARRPLGDSAVTGWRYLARRDSRVLASSEVSADADGRPTGLEQVNMGPFVQSTAQALADLSENDEIQADSYELHMLRIPALCAVILWLSSPDTDRNLFVPLAPAPSYLEAGRVYRENEIWDAVDEPVRLSLQYDRDKPYYGEE